MLSDGYLIYTFWAAGNTANKTATLCCVFPALLKHAAMAYAESYGSMGETIGALFGLKPSMALYLLFVPREKTREMRIPMVMSFFITRGVEIGTESIPQAVLQTFLLVSSLSAGADAEGGSASAQLASIASSLLAVGYILACMS